MATTNERTFTIPLRKSFVKVPLYRRTKRAISALKLFVIKHMKVEEVKMGQELNKKLWANGIRNPPGKVTVKAIKDGNVAKVELEGFEYKTQTVQTEKTEKPKTLKEKLESKLLPKEEQKSEESQPEEKKEAEPEKAPEEKPKKTVKKKVAKQKE